MIGNGEKLPACVDEQSWSTCADELIFFCFQKVTLVPGLSTETKGLATFVPDTESRL